MNSIAVARACAFMVLNLKKVFHLVHGIGKPFLDKERKKKVRSIIVKFKSWKARATFYKARPKNYVKEETV